MKKIFGVEKGITIIALVITIIVLLIISGITIGALSGDNGLINQSYENTQNAQKESFIEKVEADLYSEKTITGKMPNENTLIEILKKYGTVDNENKTVKPFVTHEGSGFGSSENDLKKLCDGADIKKGLSVPGDKVYDVKDTVNVWISH